MAPPHRRSCFNCVKSKRKCDLATPRCQRCLTRDLHCDYGKAEDGTGTSNQSHHALGESRSAGIPLDSVDIDPQLSLDIGSGTPVVGQNDFLTEEAIIAMQMNFNPPLQVPTPTTRPSSWSPLAIEDEISEDTDIEDRIVFLPEDDYITCGDSHMDRVRFGIGQLKTYTDLFCRTAHTAFIHKQLYAEDTPSVIQDALSVCALYAAKNKQNERFVWRFITQKAHELANRTMPFHSPMDLLASTQALMIYQIIRLFDGDIRQRADAEACDPILNSWADQLVARCDRSSLEL